MSREELAVGEPPDDLSDFPSVALSGLWFRAHSASHAVWWFSSDGSGRFDLTEPNGTCYLGSSVGVAVRERLGRRLSAGPVPAAVADQMLVSRVRLRARVADAIARAAERFGITREIGTVTPYDLPQRWAAALHAAGHRGVRYWPRFALAPEDLSVALFAPAGLGTRRGDPGPFTGRDALRAAGIPVIGVPRSLPAIPPPSERP
ncbi:MAG: RES family NAD+ phosphorylase [Marmoricola sp.]